MAKLDDAEITTRLKELPGWEFASDAISKKYKFAAFPDGIAFVDRVAEIAETMDHHPDITINYTRVTMTCSTHDSGGVTARDFRLAAAIEIAFADVEA